MEANTFKARSKRELEYQVTCLECGAQRHFLPTHLRLAHSMTTKDYRADNRISIDEPLYSQVFSDHASQARQNSYNRGLGSKIGKMWAAKRREASRNLAQFDHFTPKLAVEYTNIPLTTLQTAMQESRLPYGIASLLVRTKNGFASGGVVKLVNINDLESFMKVYTPKRAV